MEQINYTQDNELSKRLETIRGAIGETVIFEIGMSEANNPEILKIDVIHKKKKKKAEEEEEEEICNEILEYAM